MATGHNTLKFMVIITRDAFEGVIGIRHETAMAFAYIRPHTLPIEFLTSTLRSYVARVAYAHVWCCAVSVLAVRAGWSDTAAIYQRQWSLTHTGVPANAGPINARRIACGDTST